MPETAKDQTEIASNPAAAKGAAETRIAAVSIIVSDRSASERINAVLSAYGEYILGRMGIPYREKGISVLSVVLDAPTEITNALTGKLGKIEHVSVKALFGKL